MLASRPASSLLRENNYKENLSRVTGTKTPGRALKGRSGLQENVLHHGSVTADPREKRNGAKTPFRPDRFLSTHDLSSLKLQTTSTHGPRPLFDKTPLPNRQGRELFHTPLSKNINKLQFTALDEQEHHTTPPPSSSRKKLRVPRSSIKLLQCTPITKGDHWNVSDISIELANSSLGDVTEEDNDEPDYSDPEYMPPTAIVESYEPPFCLPDVKEAGSSLLKVARSYAVEDEPKYGEFDLECDPSPWTYTITSLDLPTLDEDDPFAAVSRSMKPSKTKTINNSTQPTVRTRSMVSARSAVPAVKQAIPPQPRSRPATSMQPRRTVTPQTSSNRASRPATALSSNLKPGVIRRAESSLKRMASKTQPKITEDAIFRFEGKELQNESDFRFTL